MKDTLPASFTAVFLKGALVKAQTFNAVQFGPAGVLAAQACLTVWRLVSLFTLTAVTLAGSSAVTHSVVDGATGLLRYRTLARSALITGITFTVATVAFSFSSTQFILVLWTMFIVTLAEGAVVVVSVLGGVTLASSTHTISSTFTLDAVLTLTGFTQRALVFISNGTLTELTHKALTAAADSTVDSSFPCAVCVVGHLWICTLTLTVGG